MTLNSVSCTNRRVFSFRSGYDKQPSLSRLRYQPEVLYVHFWRGGILRTAWQRLFASIFKPLSASDKLFSQTEVIYVMFSPQCKKEVIYVHFSKATDNPNASWRLQNVKIVLYLTSCNSCCAALMLVPLLFYRNTCVSTNSKLQRYFSLICVCLYHCHVSIIIVLSCFYLVRVKPILQRK